ncbi:MAG: hypothetical protein JWP58_102 [Hymenobacter sp.]|nr:hypothetical protein [Hymenobacter sp.]
MKQCLQTCFLLTLILALSAINNTYGQTVGTWRTPPTTACAFQ